MDPVKIAALELENVKRVRAVALEPAQDGLTVIGGRNGQGKTSVLDAIAWALGGGRRKPERATREGSATPAKLRVELSNGLIVERGGKNGDLRVTDPSGARAGQALLDSLVEELALDLPKFMAMSDREKADVLLGIAGVGDELAALDREIKALYDRRTYVGQDERSKRKVAEGMPSYAGVPDEPLSASDLIARQQGILAQNARNRALRERERETAEERRSLMEQLDRQRQDLVDRLAKADAAYAGAARAASGLEDLPTDEIERELRDIEETNEKVRSNQRRDEMAAQADALKESYDGLTRQIDGLRDRRTALLDGAGMPLPGLTVEDGRLIYGGSSWGDMSASEQLRVATAVVRAVKPECGFVLVDKLEQMDPQTLAEFGAWAESEGLQVIGTRVAVDDSCTVIIEDGYAREVGAPAAEPAGRPQKPTLTPGKF